MLKIGPGWVLPEKLGGGVLPASQNTYPIYDQNLRYSLPYLKPDQKFETQFMTRLSHENPVSDLHFDSFRSSDQGHGLLVQTNFKLP